MKQDGFLVRSGRWLVLLALARTAALPVRAAERGAPATGLVDGSAFVELLGEDALTLEVSLQGPLLKAITRVDDQLARMASGLESIHAVILKLGDEPTEKKVRERIRETETRLSRQGWQRLARVRDEGSDVVVLVHSDEKTIGGLVVMIIDDDEHQLVFANVSGVLDLAAIEKLGAELDLPGLDELSDSEP